MQSQQMIGKYKKEYSKVKEAPATYFCLKNPRIGKIAGENPQEKSQIIVITRCQQIQLYLSRHLHSRRPRITSRCLPMTAQTYFRDPL